MPRALILIISLLAAPAPLTACKSSPPEPKPDEPHTQPTKDTPTTPDDIGTDVGTDAGSTAATVDGAEVYGRVCVTCHGKTGDGKGLEQELFSFATPADEWKNGPSVAGILKTLTTGVHETSMQPFPQFDDDEKRAVAEYVLELREDLIAADETGEQ